MAEIKIAGEDQEGSFNGYAYSIQQLFGGGWLWEVRVINGPQYAIDCEESEVMAVCQVNVKISIAFPVG